MRLCAIIIIAAMLAGCTTVTVHVWDSTIWVEATGVKPCADAREKEVR